MTPKFIIGIDPGLSGALARYDGETLEVVDIPTYTLTKGKRSIDEYSLARIIDDWAPSSSDVWLELVGTRPGEGAVGAFSFGKGYGMLRGICAANFLTIIDVTPASWKRAMGVKGEKDESRMRATVLLPRHADKWPLKKHDGRAESALIALHGWRQTHGAA